MKLTKIKKFDPKFKSLFKLNTSKKRVITVIACAGLIGLSVYLNIALSANDGDTALSEPAPSPQIVETDAGNYFETFKSERDDVREKELFALETIAGAEDADESIVEDAQAQRLALIAAMETEQTIEGLLLAKGFSAVAVTVSSNSVNVVVDPVELSDARVAQILDIAGTESGQPAENIKVIPLN